MHWPRMNMDKVQFRILYREFLFRVVDLEVLSADAQGDASKILGQFAALPVLLSAWTALLLFGVAANHTPAVWGIEHLLIATTMLLVGLFAVLSWDSTFPDRRDVLVLAPLPVHTGTIFVAKVAASAMALCVTVLALQGLPSVAWALGSAASAGGILDWLLSPVLYRSFAAYAATMLSAGGFIYGSILCVQGICAQLLPRRHFLRVSAILQMGAFCLLLCVYFLQPSLATPQALGSVRNQQTLAWLPSYWFLGLFQQLSGSMPPVMEPLARRAWIGLAVTGFGSVAVYALSYLRTLRQIVEEPDIMPGSGRGGWLPDFGNSLETAVTQFSVRTLLRSRQHRLILAFYFGLGFALTILFLKTPNSRQILSAGAGSEPRRQVSGAMLASSIVMMSAWVVGTRVVFSLPLDLRANWIFRITPIRGGTACLQARRRALAVLTLIPAWLASAVVFLWVWPWRPATGHLLVLGVLGFALTELCLHGAQKIPFTCSYLPGRSNFHMTFWLCIGLLWILVANAAEFERRALWNFSQYRVLLLVIGFAAILARWRTARVEELDGSAVKFEEEADPVVMSLGLHRDGTVPMS